MNIGSGMNTVSSLYGQQKGNHMKTPASAEKTFYTAETPKVYQIFTTDNMLWTGGNGTGLSYCLKYADDSTDENPVVLAKGVDENGKEFEQRIYINDVNPSNATVVEMRALEAHYKVEKQGGFTSLLNNYFGCNFKQLLNKYRVEYAKSLLLEGTYSTSSLFRKCGFASQSVFYAAFHKVVGASPLQFLYKAPSKRRKRFKVLL